MDVSTSQYQELKFMDEFATKLKRIFLDVHLSDDQPDILSEYDGSNIVRVLHEAGVQVLTLWFKDHWGNAYYPTKVGKMHPLLRGRDMDGEIVSACRNKGIDVIAYYSVGVDAHVGRTYQEWVAVDSEGKKERGTWVQICLNSPYRGYVMNQLKEIAGTYNVHGFWLDMTFYGSYGHHWGLNCYCEYCKEKYRLDTGEEMPIHAERTSKAFQRWFRWRRNVWLEFLREARGVIKTTRPQAMVTGNYFGHTFVGWTFGYSCKQSEYFDYLSAEAYAGNHGQLAVSLVPSFLRARSNGRPFEVLVTRFTRLWDWGFKSLEQLTCEAMTILSHGGAVAIDDHLHPKGYVTSAVYGRIREVFQRLDKVGEFAINLQPIPYVALVYSEDTKDLYAGDYLEGYASSFHGAYKALLEDHVPLDILYVDQLTPETLSKYKVLLLPNLAIMREDTAVLIDSYFRKGGGVVATYETSLYTEELGIRDNFGMRSLGARYQGRLPHRYTFLQFKEIEPLTSGIERDFPIAMKESSLKAAPLDRGIGKIVCPMMDYDADRYPYSRHITHPPYPPPGPESEYPAVIVNEKEGRAVYFPGKIDTSYAYYSTRDCARLLRNAVRWAGGPPPMFVNGSIVHLVNFGAESGRQCVTPKVDFQWIENLHLVDEINPVHDVELFLDKNYWTKQGFSKVQTSKGDALPISKENQFMKTTLSSLEIHEAIVIS
jgi:hypothetical protein